MRAPLDPPFLGLLQETGSDDLMMAVLLIPIAGIIGFSVWASVVGFARQRRLEREAYYRGEVNKKLVEEGRLTVADLVAAREDELRRQWLKRREGFKGAGIVLFGLGLAIIGGMGAANEEEGMVAGLVPFFLGSSLLAYGLWLYPRWETVRGKREPGAGGPPLL